MRASLLTSRALPGCQDLIVYPEGGCPRNNPRYDGVVDVTRLDAVGGAAGSNRTAGASADAGAQPQQQQPPSDGGNCLFSVSSLQACMAQPKGMAGLNALVGTSTAVGDACRAVCSAEPCDHAALYVAGPVPLSYGCCDQARGDDFPCLVAVGQSNRCRVNQPTLRYHRRRLATSPSLFPCGCTTRGARTMT